MLCKAVTLATHCRRPASPDSRTGHHGGSSRDLAPAPGIMNLRRPDPDRFGSCAPPREHGTDIGSVECTWLSIRKG